MWTCGHCETEMEHKYDYCTTCEEFGCTANDHKCNEVDPAQAGLISLVYMSLNFIVPTGVETRTVRAHKDYITDEWCSLVSVYIF